MPPTRGRRKRKGNATRGQAYANPNKQSPSQASSQWPHLTKAKQDRQPLNAQPGCAFLSLHVDKLESHIINNGSELLSQRASIFSSQKAADQVAKEKAQLVEAERVRAEQQALQQKQKVEKRRLVKENVAFVTLKLSTSALERSELPFAKTWTASRVTSVKSTPDQEPQTSDLKPSNLESRIPTLLPPSVSNELELKQRPVTRSVALLTTIPVKDPEPTDHYTPGDLGLATTSPTEPEFSPITPTTPNLQGLSFASAPGISTRIQSDSSHEDFESPDREYLDMSGKSPTDVGGVDESIKDVIQNLFVMQQHVASFRPEIQDGLERKVGDVAVSLQNLDDLVANPSNPIHKIKIAPDIIDYVDDGRNPDIYTRDFVELVQRGNAVLNGKQRAFRNFSKILAKSLKDNFEGMNEEVDLIMQNAGMEEKDGKFVEKQQNGSNPL